MRRARGRRTRCAVFPLVCLVVTPSPHSCQRAPTRRKACPGWITSPGPSQLRTVGPGRRARIPTPVVRSVPGGIAGRPSGKPELPHAFITIPRSWLVSSLGSSVPMYRTSVPPLRRLAPAPSRRPGTPSRLAQHCGLWTGPKPGRPVAHLRAGAAGDVSCDGAGRRWTTCSPVHMWYMYLFGLDAPPRVAACSRSKRKRIEPGAGAATISADVRTESVLTHLEAP